MSPTLYDKSRTTANNAIGFAKRITAKASNILPQNENLLFYVAVNVAMNFNHLGMP